MIGIISASTGALIFPEPGTKKNIVLDLIEGKKQDSNKAQYLYSAAQDWEEVEGPTIEVLLESATEEYRVAKSVSLVRMALGGLKKSLAKRVFQEVEELLDGRISTKKKVLARLLVAPLNTTDILISSTMLALSKGCSTIASLLDELEELQPLLHRFTDIWLGLPESIFENFMEPKEAIWVVVVEKGDIKQLLKAATGKNFTVQWNLLTFCFTSPQSRSGINSLAR
ncbi:MAG: hypothetical protein PF450_05380 [Bacteroidales bacterium]|jgi:hypothetical protein|nr:hypothetical protein [Bacteroidales bacterium]